MSTSRLHRFVEQFCDAGGPPALKIDLESGGASVLSVNFQGVDLSICHDQLRHPDHALVLAFFAHVPEHNEVLILRELLHANLSMMRPNSPSFSRNPLTGNVMLQYAVPLIGEAGENLWAAIQDIAESILVWRQNISLDQVVSSTFFPFNALVLRELV